MKNNNYTKSVLKLQILKAQNNNSGLIDYESSNHEVEYFDIYGGCKIFKNWQKSQIVIYSNEKIKKGILPDQNFSFLCSITRQLNQNCQKFILSQPQTPTLSTIQKQSQKNQPINTNTYIVVRFYKENYKARYRLQPGNIVKLGKVEFKIAEIGGTKKIYQKKYQINEICYVNQQATGKCKICLIEEQSIENFLLSPCKCKGSVSVVHIQCLKQWISLKVKKESNGVIVSYNYTKLQCQICKDPFPRIVIKKQKQFQMVTIQKPKNIPYLILEGINQRQQSKEQISVHLLYFQENGSFKIGRSQQCDIILKDNSVSRMHAEIIYTEDEFYIYDLKSKFGTLIKLDKQIQLNQNIKLQAGTSLLQFAHQYQ